MKALSLICLVLNVWWCVLLILRNLAHWIMSSFAGLSTANAIVIFYAHGWIFSNFHFLVFLLSRLLCSLKLFTNINLWSFSVTKCSKIDYTYICLLKRYTAVDGRHNLVKWKYKSATQAKSRCSKVKLWLVRKWVGVDPYVSYHQFTWPSTL